jgi:hypothetical protein
LSPWQQIHFLNQICQLGYECTSPYHLFSIQGKDE